MKLIPERVVCTDFDVYDFMIIHTWVYIVFSTRRVSAIYFISVAQLSKEGTYTCTFSSITNN